MKRFLPYFFTAIIISILSGCATIVNDSQAPVTITSNPDGAKFIVSSGEQGITPATIDLKRGSDYTIEITKPGYQPQTQVLNSHFDHWLEATLGNIWNDIIPGLIVDAIDGLLSEIKRVDQKIDSGFHHLDQKINLAINVHDRLAALEARMASR